MCYHPPSQSSTETIKKTIAVWKESFLHIGRETIFEGITWLTFAYRGTQTEFENGDDHTTCWLFFCAGFLCVMASFVSLCFAVVEKSSAGLLFLLLFWACYVLLGNFFHNKWDEMEELE